MLYRLGFMLIMFGMMTADSESLVLPFALVAIGSVLILRAKIKEADNETAKEEILHTTR